MKRFFNGPMLAIVAWMLTVIAVASAEAPFKAAEAVSVSNAFHILLYATNQIVPDAFVVLNLCLNAKGSIEKVDVLRDPVSMANIASLATRSWKFRPASDGGEAIASQVPIVFVYRPLNIGPNFGSAYALEPIDLKPALTEQDCTTKSTYAPAAILAAAYPDYPVNSVVWGSVIIQVTVDAMGRIKVREVLRPMLPFTQFALDALKKWRFQAAMLQGESVDSKVIVVFVFQSPSN